MTLRDGHTNTRTQPFIVKDNINMSDLSKIVMVIVVVVVLHGQNCIINENWLYKPILKDTYIDLF